MKKADTLATVMGIVVNALLFIAKIIVGVMYSSIAIISDAVNSFSDIVSSFVVHFSTIVSYKRADKEHQFGHKRAQPIAGLIVSILIAIVGFQLVVYAFTGVLEGKTMKKGLIPIVLVVIVMLTKLSMYLYTRAVVKKTKNRALHASSIDHKDDFLISITVLIGVGAANMGYPMVEPIVAMALGLWIIKAGYDIGRDNLKYLMGEAPSKELFEKIEEKAKSVKEVIGLNDVRAHYVGTLLEAEVHIYVNKKMDIEKAHDIGKKVQKRLESMEEISRAFIHIDPFEGKFEKERKF
jgi:cation diffusion facilitator family transporter